MPTPTYKALATVTLGSAASSVTFSSIPATYRDLVLVADVIGTSTSSAAFVLNTDATTTNYNRVINIGFGSGGGTPFAANENNVFGMNTAGRTFAIFQIQDSSATDKHKTSLYRITDPDAETVMGAIRWSNTAAVTSVRLSTAGSFATGSRFDLYGIVS
jgi:hypothetical protein